MTDSRLNEFLAKEITSLKEKGLFRPLRTLETAQGAEVVIDGHRLITLSTNNYLGLTGHPKLREAAMRATEEFGVGAGSVRTIAGTMSLHQELETKLAAFKKTEATLVLQSGFACNLGVLSALMLEGDLIISDELNHASIIDGIRLSKAARHVYKHKDLDSLRQVLQDNIGKYNKMLVVTDGVFSMDGDIAPLPGIVELARQFGAAVMVDDAHASGVLGDHGRGTTSHFNLYGQVDIQIGTLSKAVGAVGGYVAGSQALRDYLIHRARPFLFSTAHPPAVAATCIAALEVMATDDSLHERLWENTRYFKQKLQELGFNTGNSETPITPVIVGDSSRALQLSDVLFREGVFAQGIVYPTVPEGKARVRTIVTAAHTREQLDICLVAFARAGREVGVIS